MKTTKISDKGIVLTTNNVNNLGVGKGGNVTINGKQVLVSEESNQYFHPITYLSKAQMDELGIEYVSSFLLNISDENAFLNYISENENQCLIVFTRSLERDLRSIFNSIDIFIYIMIIFSLAISFAILSIMNQNALMEMQRQLSVMRAIGFKVSDISAFWTLQTVLQTLSGAVIAVPAGCFFSNMLFNMASSNNQKYPFVFSWPYLWLAILFITVVIVLCHLFAMNTIRKWNIADNTRSRE